MKEIIHTCDSLDCNTQLRSWGYNIHYQVNHKEPQLCRPHSKEIEDFLREFFKEEFLKK